jgi:hypothetical protein
VQNCGAAKSCRNFGVPATVYTQCPLNRYQLTGLVWAGACVRGHMSTRRVSNRIPNRSHPEQPNPDSGEKGVKLSTVLYLCTTVKQKSGVACDS